MQMFRQILLLLISNVHVIILTVQSGGSDLITDWPMCALGRGLYPNVSVDWLVDRGACHPLADTNKHSTHDDDGQRSAKSNGDDDND